MHLTEMGPYLIALPQNMHEGMNSITTDIIDAMGHMQFQDINRQLLEQVESALGSLSDHSASLYALVGGDASRKGDGTEVVYARANITPEDIKLPEPEVPKIELF